MNFGHRGRAGAAGRDLGRNTGLIRDSQDDFLKGQLNGRCVVRSVGWLFG